MSHGGDGARLETGSLFGRYRIVRKIGDGGMATIYLAHSSGPDGFSKPCALKVLRPEFAARPEVTQMLVREAKLSGVLSHANIVQVFDFGQVGSDYFLVMEWVDGTTLSRAMVEAVRIGKPLSIGTAAKIALSLGEALAYLQDGVEVDGRFVNLVHRDVSPSNVLISRSGAVKLSDFGIVKVLEAPDETQVGVVKGKYAYMSPEQIRGEPLDHRSDIFALGIILFELLTRQRLFRRKTLPATVAAVHATRVPVPSSLNPEIPPELDAIVLRALAKRPADRYGSARELLRDLWPFAQSAAEPAERELSRVLEEMARRASPTQVGALLLPTDDDDSVSISFDPMAMGESSTGTTADLDGLEELAGAPIELIDDRDDSVGTWLDSDVAPARLPWAPADGSDAIAIPASAPPPAPTVSSGDIPKLIHAGSPPRVVRASSPPRSQHAAAFAEVGVPEVQPPHFSTLVAPAPPQPKSALTYAVIALSIAATVIFWTVVLTTRG